MMLTGRKAVVTGAARGLGASIATALLKAGAKVMGLDIRGAQHPPSTGTGGSSYGFIRCDVSQRSEVHAAFDEVRSAFGSLDILVAAAGIDRPGHRAEEIPLEIWDEIMNTNARGTFLTNQAAFPLMKTVGGRIINLGSHAGIRGNGERAAYSASKGAVLAWTRAAAIAWGPHGVMVNAIAPQMRTEVADRYLESLPAADRAAFFEKLRERVPVGGRLGAPEQDLVPLILFLAGEGAGFITGQVFAVDGGMTMLGS